MLDRENCALLLVDIQGGLAKMVHNSDAVISSTRKLIRCCQLLSIPIIWLEQNPKGLGATVPEISELMAGIQVYEKFHFNGVSDDNIIAAISALGRQQWLVAGIEAHICVYQSVIGLLNGGYQVEVVSDCISSRSPVNREIAIAKMQAGGASITSVEMAAFELMRHSKTACFKDVLSVIKEEGY